MVGCGVGQPVPLLTVAASAPWRPSHAGPGGNAPHKVRGGGGAGTGFEASPPSALDMRSIPDPGLV